MKKKSLIFKEQRNAVWKKIVALRAKSEEAEDGLTDEEVLEMRTLEKEYDAFADKILNEEKHEARAAEQVAREMEAEQRAAAAAEERSDDQPAADHRRFAAAKPTPEARAIKEFRFIKAIRQAANNEKLDGVEAEMYTEAMNEASGVGIAEMRGNVAVPSFFMDFEKRTTLTAGTPATAGNLIATGLGELIGALRPNLVLDQLGVRRLGGLVGNLDFPRKDSNSTATWVGEGVTSPESNPTIGKISLSPKRLTSTTVVSDQLMRQSSIDVEAMVREDLNLSISEKLNETMINGSGAGDIPIGILNIPSLQTVALGTNGDDPTHAAIEKMISLVDEQNALMGNLGFVLNPSGRYKLKITKKDAGSAVFLMEKNNELAGYLAANTTHVPKNLTKGTGTNLSAALFGNFNDFIIAQWGGVSLIVDPYSKKKEAETEVTIHSYHDTDYRHVESFAAILDMVTT